MAQGLTITSCSIHDNIGVGTGSVGGIWNGPGERGTGDLTIIDSEIYQNSGSIAGGIWDLSGPGAALTLINTSVHHNQATVPQTHAGGGIYRDGEATLHTSNTTVCLNRPNECVQDDAPSGQQSGPITPCTTPLNPCPSSTYVCGPNYQCLVVPPGVPPGPYNQTQCEAICHPPKAQPPPAL